MNIQEVYTKLIAFPRHFSFKGKLMTRCILINTSKSTKLIK